MLTDPLSDEVIDERKDMIGEELEFIDGPVLDVAKLSNAEIEPESLDWTYYPKAVIETWNNFVNRVGDNFIYNWIVFTFIMYRFYIITNEMIQNYGVTGNVYIFIRNLLICYSIFSIIIVVSRNLMIHDDTAVADDEYDGVEKKCFAPEKIGININGWEPSYPTFCFGRSVTEYDDDDVTIKEGDPEECPYGCYYTGDEESKKCKNNRSVFSIKGLFEPRLNLPASRIDDADWYNPEDDPDNDGTIPKNYVCPPYPSYRSKFPYDTLCSSGQTRCIPTKDSSSIISSKPDEYCEIQYRLSEKNDNQCIQNNFPPLSDEGPRGPIHDSTYKCQIDIPDFSKDTHCPFKMATTELQDFDEIEQRQPVEMWQWIYDEVFDKGESISEPEHIAWQNENRYLIVNKNYDKGLFD